MIGAEGRHFRPEKPFNVDVEDVHSRSALSARARQGPGPGNEPSDSDNFCPVLPWSLSA
jgi:hypothetical protein